jgi:predicted P-loop ATPase
MKIKDANDVVRAGFRLDPNDVQTVQLQSNVVPISQPDPSQHTRSTSWQQRLIPNQYGAPKTSIANAMLILSHDDDWRGVLRYNERSEEPIFCAPPPFFDCPDSLLETPRPLKDADDVRTAQWLEERYGLTPSLPMVHAVTNAIAMNASFDPVRDYLERVAWDGTERLNMWTGDYLGAQASPYAQAVGRLWMISAVARTMQPGCKADHVLVLEGKQGTGKSTALKILAGEEHFGDDIPPVGSKDAQDYLGGLWIVELAGDGRGNQGRSLYAKTLSHHDERPVSPGLRKADARSSTTLRVRRECQPRRVPQGLDRWTALLADRVLGR